MDQMSFDFGQAERYMRQFFGFEKRREELTAEVNAARTLAREMGVPTKAVELAIKAERNHAKALLVVSQEEFDALRAAARVMQEMDESVEEVVETFQKQGNVRMWAENDEADSA